MSEPTAGVSLPVMGGARPLAGRYPVSVSRQRVAAQVRTLRLARRIITWGEQIMSGKIEATTEQKLLLAKLILPRALPALSEQAVATASLSLVVDERRVAQMAADLVEQVRDSERSREAAS